MSTEALTDPSSQPLLSGVVSAPKTLPPLENGDRLTRCEFERRYDAMPNLKKAELIEGVVYMPSPVRVENHGEPHAGIMTWLGVYRAATPGTRFADNTTLRLDPDNEPQPDAMIWISKGASTTARISEDDYLEGAPELIVEVSASSASYDLHDKLKAYRRNGVQEYVVWRVYDQQVDWFRLEAERYVPVPPDSDGVVHSRVFPGLCLNVVALVSGDLARVLADLQKGLDSTTHAEFVERLAAQSHTE